MSRQGWARFAAMCVIWGLPYLLIRVAVRDLSPVSVVFARTAIGALLLLPIALRRRSFRGLARYWRWLAAYTVVEVTVPWLLLSDAEVHLTSSLAGLLVAITPLVGLVLSRATGGDELVDARRVGGLVIGIGGVAALVGLQLGHIDLVSVGEIAVVAVGYGLGPIIVARRLRDAPAMGVVVVSLAATAVVYAPFTAVRPPRHLDGEVVAAMLALAAVCTAIAFVLFFALIADIGPSRAVVITYVNPAVAIALGATVLGEHVTMGMIIGFPLVLAGSVLATTPSRRADRRQPAAVTPG